MPIYTIPPAPAGQQGWGTPGEPLGAVRVTLGEVTFGQTDDYGVEWILTNLRGWFELPGSTGEMEQRASDHGGWPSPSYTTPRLIEVEGHAQGPWEALSAALDRLNAAISVSRMAPVAVMDRDGTTRQADVRQGGDPLFARNPASVNVSLSLVAPDPRKYATTVTTAETGLPQTSGGIVLPRSLPYTINATVDSGVLVAHNAGNMSTRPTLRVYGPAPEVRITHRNSGRTLVTHEAVAAGRFLELDTDRKLALLDGTAARLVTGSWFEYEPGDNEVAVTASTYDAGTRLWSQHRSAWR